MIKDNRSVKTDKNIGRQLAKDIFNENGILILPVSTVLSEEHLQKLAIHRISLQRSDLVSKHIQKENELSEIVETAIAQVKGIFQDIRYLNRIPLMEVRNKLLPTIQFATKDSNLNDLFSVLQSKDDYTYRHTISVGIIATLIGKWLNLSESTLSALSIAASLHDIGKIKVPEEILNKPGKLTNNEFEIMKKHTIYGYEMIKNTVGISHRQALVALQHHERVDGSGYPFGLRGSELDLFSHIVAISDVFHAMTSKRVYHNKKPMYQVLKQMQQDTYGKLDAKLSLLFIKKIMDAMVGNEVLLSDNRIAKVVYIYANDPIHPLVQVDDDEFVNLSTQTDITFEILS